MVFATKARKLDGDGLGAGLSLDDDGLVQVGGSGGFSAAVFDPAADSLHFSDSSDSDVGKTDAWADIAALIFAGTGLTQTAGVGAIDESAALDWTGAHTFTAAPAVGGVALATLDDLRNLDAKDSVRAATTSALSGPSGFTYDNGSSGVGATLTGDDTTALDAIDGQAWVEGEDYLIQDQANPAHNGIFTLTQDGDGGSNAAILTRRTDFDDATNITALAVVSVETGTVNGGKAFYLSQTSAITVGTTNLTFSFWAGLSAGAGVTISGTGSVSVTGYTDASAGQRAGLKLLEDTDNGSSGTTLQPAAALTTDRTVTFGDLDLTFDQDVSDSAAPVFAVTNMTGSAAGLDSDAATHIASDGSDHSFIDQNVSIGQAPSFVGTNFTGIPDGALSPTVQDLVGNWTPASASSQSKLVLDEDTDNGAHSTTIQGAASMTTDRTITFQDADGTVALSADIPTAGTGLDSSFNLALSELTGAVFAPASDSLPFLDSDGSATRIDAWSDIAALIVNNGITAASGVLGLATALYDSVRVATLESQSGGTGADTTIDIEIQLSDLDGNAVTSTEALQVEVFDDIDGTSPASNATITATGGGDGTITSGSGGNFVNCRVAAGNGRVDLTVTNAVDETVYLAISASGEANDGPALILYKTHDTLTWSA